MAARLARSSGEGLERSCVTSRDWVRTTAPAHGLELMRAWFAGQPYARHRHDTYALSLTDLGIQTFDYAGATRASAPGQVVVLHPDEPHDGRAGTEEGFGYRQIYLAPARVAAAAEALCGAVVPLPYVKEAVSLNLALAQSIARAFRAFPTPLEPLAADALIAELAAALIAADRALRHRRRAMALDQLALERARRFLEAECHRVVSAAELEQVTGLDRFALMRQFGQRFGTSPYRYLLLRRLDRVRRALAGAMPLAQVAADIGFADQAHMTRMFRAAHGLSPAQYRAALKPGSSPPRRRAPGPSPG